MILITGMRIIVIDSSLAAQIGHYTNIKLHQESYSLRWLALNPPMTTLGMIMSNDLEHDDDLGQDNNLELKPRVSQRPWV